MIDDDGEGPLRRVRGLLTIGLAFLIRADRWPMPAEADLWQREARKNFERAAEEYQPWMHDLVDLQRLYRKALWLVPQNMDGEEQVFPRRCPVTLNELLDPSFEPPPL